MNATLTGLWTKYKVFIFGLLGAIAVSLQELLTANTGDADLKVYGFAILMAGLSFIATQWRGQGVTILGILGTLAGVFVTMQQTGNFTWTQFITFAIAALLSAVAPPPKPVTYEKDAAIVQAKEVPAVDQVEIPPTVKILP